MMRVVKRAVAAAAVVAVVPVLAPTAAGAAVANPGATAFTGTDVVVGLGSATAVLASEVAQCADGADNDGDLVRDFPADPKCTSADDWNEFVAGHQPRVTAALPGTVTIGGTWTVPMAGMSFPPMSIPTQVGDVVGRFRPVADAVGSVDPITGVVRLTVKARITLWSGAIDITGCTIGTTAAPITVALSSEKAGGARYSPATGRARLTAADFAVPAATNCGAFGMFNGVVNAQAGLPMAAGSARLVLGGTFSPRPLANHAPVARVTASATTGIAPHRFNFSGSGSTDADGRIVSHQWNFGDGTTATGVSASRTYSTPGTYTVKLRVTDDLGASHTRSITVTVAANRLPVARITATRWSGRAPVSTTFSGTGSSDPDGRIVGYRWSFGDGTTATGATVSKTYRNRGTYTVRLTVTDNKGGTRSTSGTITVS